MRSRLLPVLLALLLPAVPVLAATAASRSEEAEEGPSAIEQFLNASLGTVNKIIGGLLFFDVTRGAFQTRKLVNRNGATIYAVDAEGNITNEDGSPAKFPMMSIKYQKGTDGKPGRFVDDQGREVLFMDHESTSPMLVLDDEGNLLNTVGEAAAYATKDGQWITVSWKDGKIVDDSGREVNLRAIVEDLENTVSYTEGTAEVPFVVVILVLGSIFFTFWYGWINIRGFKHSINVVRGKYDNPEDKGEISHFRALTSALSATVGLGNIAGVAIAIQLGGPGAVFWMLCTAVFGMTAKFSSCTLAQLFRQQNPDGSISGGPMYYLDLGLKSKGPILGVLGKILGIMYAFMVMGGALGGGNMFQSNQSFEALSSTFGLPDGTKYAFGIIMAILVGFVILGGIKRIGAATSKIVPWMCGIYVLTAMVIIVANMGAVPATIATIFEMAFSKNAFFGGMVGVLIWGVMRAAFSNEAGLGSAAIAHAAAKTDEPVREGMVAMIGPFIDTIIVCLMTALVIIITGAWQDPDIPQKAGVALTTSAFGSVSFLSWFPYLLSICILLFAYSTMISWCYYGERGWIYLLDHLGAGKGLKSVNVFRVIFVIFVFIGAVTKLGVVLDFSDLMILCMAFPNIIGSVILAPTVLVRVKDYWGRYTSGQMPARN